MVSPLAMVEPLEPHLLLSTVTWVHASGGDWNTAANWSTDSVPGSGDTAVISGLNSGASVDYDSGTSSTVASVEASSPLQITYGSLTVTGAVDVTGTTLTVGGGTLEFGSSASLSVTGGGQVDLNSGELTVDGTLNITNLDFSGGTLGGGGSASLSGTSTWSGGTDEVPLAVESGAQLNVTGGDVSLVGGGSAPALDNSGTIDLTGDIFLYDSGVITNESGGVFDVEDSSGGIVAGDSTSLTFNNYGQIQDIDDSEATFSVPLDNQSTGTLEVTDSGTLQLDDGGSNANSGTTAFTADSGTVEFSGGTFTFDGNATASATDGGQIELNGGELSLGGTLSINGLDFGSGTIDSSGSVSLSGTDTWDGGTEAASLSVTSGSVLDITGGVSLGDDDAADVTLDNSGTINLSGNLTLYNSATVANESDGVFNIEGSGSSVGCYDSSGAVFDNYGLLEDTGDTDAALWLPLVNEPTGAVDVTDSGMLQINSGGSNANSSTTAFTADGATIDFAQGTFTFSGDATVSSVGAGQIEVSGGEVTVDGTLNATGLDFTGGTIDGSTGSVALSGTDNTWSDGTLSTSMAIGTDDSINISTGVSISTTITDLGTINLTSGGAVEMEDGAEITGESSGGTLNESDGAELQLDYSANATLNNMTITGAEDQGNIDASRDGANLTISGNLNFNGTLALGTTSMMTVSSSGTISGGGTITTQQTGSATEATEEPFYSSQIQIATGATETIGEGTTLAGGVIVDSTDYQGALINDGTIETSLDQEFEPPGDDPAPQAITLPCQSLLTNSGYISVSDFGSVGYTDSGSPPSVDGAAMAISPTEAVFGWTGLPMNAGDTYLISKTIDGVHFTPVTTTLPGGNYYVAEGLEPNTDYQFQVEEISPSGATWSYRSGTVETNIDDPSTYASHYNGIAPLGVSTDQFGFYQVSDVHTILEDGGEGALVSSGYNSGVIAAGSPEGAFLQAIDGLLTTQELYSQVELPYAYDGEETAGIGANQGICTPGYFGQNDQYKASVTPVSTTNNPSEDGDPIILSDGDTQISDIDLASSAFGDGWSITRNWTAQDTFVPDTTFGNGWMNQTSSYLQAVSTSASSPNILLVQSAYNQTLFGYNAGTDTYAPLAVSNDSLTYNSSNDTYTWLDTTTGDENIYYGFTSTWATNLQGKLKQSLDADGNQTTLTYVDGLLNTVTQTDPAGDTATFQYDYFTSGDNAGKVSLIQQIIQRAGEPAETVQQAAYAYYDVDEAYGNLGDLKTVTIEDGDENVLGEDYYRYYTPTDLADGENGFVGGLKYSFSTDSFDKLSAAYSDPFTATDAQVAVYADEYYEYDSSRRVTKEVVGSMGESSALGQGTYLYSYYLDPNLSSATEDFNTWAMRTTETIPNGNQDIFYTSIDGDGILEIENVSTDSGNPADVGDNWITGDQYDSFGRLLTTISPSAIDLSASILGGATAVSGIEAAIEPYADLGLSEGLVYSNQGLINGTTYYGSTSATSSTAGGVTGFVETDYVQNGADGTQIDQDSYTYFSHSDFAGMTIYPVAAYTVYQSNSGDGDPATTTYDYTWQSNSSGVTNQVDQETTTNPVVSSAENGSGIASSTYTLYNAFGQPVWTMDGNGYITYTAYDNVTGAVVQSIQDVQTSDLSDLANYSGTSFTDGYNEFGVPALPSPPPPPGSIPSWTTPGGAGLNYVTTDYVDGLGRTIEEVSPAGNITLYVYDDIDRATFTLPGVILDTEDDTLTTTGPITMDRTAILYSYTQDDQALEGMYDEALTFSINTPINYTGGSSGEAILPSLPGFIQGDGASSGPDNVLNLIGTGSSSSPQFTLQSLTRSLYDSSGRVEGQLVESDAYASLSDASYLATAAGNPYSGTSISRSTGSGNYAASYYAWDDDGWRYQIIDADGTIYDTVYDALDRAVSEWIGTDDAASGASGTPAYFVGSNAGTGNNMTEVESDVYDNGGVGDGNLTEEIQYVDSSSSDNRVTLNLYDWRDRLIATKQGAMLNSSGNPNPSGETDSAHRLITYTTYDNLDEPTAVYTYAGDGVSLSDFATWTSSTDASDLRAYTSTSYDSLGQVYLTRTYSVNPTSGAIGSSLATNYFYDYDGNLLEESDPGGIVTKHEYNGAGQDIKDSTTDGSVINGSGLSWSDADDSTDANDVVIEQTINKYDADGNLIETEDLQRFDSDPSTATGDLAGPSGGDLASRDYYMGYVYDAADRQTESVNVGTNGGSSWSWSDGIPSGSLVTQTAYDAAGNPSVVTDPRGIMTKTVYDMLGDVIETIDAWDGTSAAIPTGDTNQTTTYTYDGDGNELTMTAVMPSGTNSQTTAYIYGTTSTSGVFSNDLLSTVEYPSASTGEASTASTDDQSYTYNKQGQQLTFSDQNGTTHTYGYDVLGRLTSDTATTLGSGVSGDTRRLGYSFNDAGLPFEQTSYYNTTGTNVENQVEDIYNGYGQLITQYQADSGSVNTSSTPSVQYGYSQPTGANYSRLTSMTYPDGRVVDYDYNSGIDTTISRLSGMSDPSGANIESYSYLGLSQIVREVRPGSVMTLVMANGGSTGDGGDIYIGLDRFGRVVDEVWTTSDTPLTASDSGTQDGDILGTITEQFEYGYDQDGNVLYELNGVNANFSELFTYDDLNRLTSAQRGTLNSSDTSITTANTLAGSSQSWDLDSLGNQLSVTTGGTETDNTTNSKNELTENGSSALTYDHDGDMTEDQNGTVYVYDAWNRLVEAEPNGVYSEGETYTYNAGGERPGLSMNICNGTITSSYYSTNWQDLEDDVTSYPCGAQTTTSTYVWSVGYIDDLVERDQSVDGGSATRIYAEQDAHHDITSLVSSSGGVLERFVYEAYGTRTVLSASWSTHSDSYNWVYGFQGGRLDPVDGLINFRNRDLNPTTGTWMEQDPAGYINGPDRYQFLASNPQLYVDPNGLFVEEPVVGDPGVGTISSSGGGGTVTGTAGGVETGGGAISSTGGGGEIGFTAGGGDLAGAGTVEGGGALIGEFGVGALGVAGLAGAGLGYINYKSGLGGYIGTTELGEADADALMDMFGGRAPTYYPPLPNPLQGKPGGSGRRPPGGRPPIGPPQPPGKPPCFVAGTEVLMADGADPSVTAAAADPIAVSDSRRRRDTERQIGVGLIVLGVYGAFVIHRVRRILLLKQAAEHMQAIQPIEMELCPPLAKSNRGRLSPMAMFCDEPICAAPLI